MAQDQNDKKAALLENQTKLLMQSFDCVQIFAVKYDKESHVSTVWTWGDGSFYTRYGQIREWMHNLEERMRNPPGQLGEPR